MPRSIGKRLELLEKRTVRRAPPATLEDLFARYERMVAEGHPLARLESFRVAWADFLTARSRVASCPDEPPAWYKPNLPQPERRQRWVLWDHHEVDRALCRVMEVVVEHGRPPSPPGSKTDLNRSGD